MSLSIEISKFSGLIPAIVYFAYGRLLAEVGLSVSSSGVHRKQTAESTPVDGVEMRKHEQEAKAKAMSYINSAEVFLDTEIALYPLFREPRNINNRAYTGFNFSKV